MLFLRNYCIHMAVGISKSYLGIDVWLDTQIVQGILCAGEFTEDGQVFKRQWVNAEFTFDDLWHSMVSLFVCLTLDGYLPIMNSGMSTTSKGMQPRQNANPTAFAFFLLYVLVVVFAMMQMFIGIVFYQYSKIRQEREGISGLNGLQRQWLEISSAVRCSHFHHCYAAYQCFLFSRIIG